MKTFKATAEVARPCEVLIKAKTRAEAFRQLKAGEYDAIINEQGGAGCEDVRALIDHEEELEPWDDA